MNWKGYEGGGRGPKGKSRKICQGLSNLCADFRSPNLPNTKHKR